MAFASRLKRELQMLSEDPPHGVCAWTVGDDLSHLQAQIEGPEDTPYHYGVFKVDVEVPQRYPFEPPRVRFVTPIYHPNVDNSGLICLDTLKMPPNGSWKPSINIPTLLATIRQLMLEPNPDDGLMVEITSEYRQNRALFLQKARIHTDEHARPAEDLGVVEQQKRKASHSEESSPKRVCADEK